MKHMNKLLIAALGLLFVAAASGQADAAIFNYTALADYLAAAGPQTKIAFTEVALGTALTNEYAGLGATFVDGDDLTLTSASFVEDGVGLIGRGNDIFEVSFAGPINSVGFAFPGALRIDLYDGVSFIGASDDFAGVGSGFFGGVVSTQSFNRIVVSDWYIPPVYVDDMYFGSAVPEPGTIALLGIGLAGLAARRRNRKS